MIQGQQPEIKPSVWNNAVSQLLAIAIGHGIKHWYLAAFAVFLPLIEEEYALTALGVSVLVTARQFGTGAPNFFVGYVSDRLRNQWHNLLPISLALAAISYVFAGLVPWYGGVVLFISLAGAAAAFWHPPALSMLSTHFPDRRGMAIAIHGAGSGAGESLGPLGVGFILAMIMEDDWRLYVVLSVVPALLVAVLLRHMLVKGWSPHQGNSEKLAKITDFFVLLRYPVFLTLAGAHIVRTFANIALLTFLPLYLARDLGMNSAGVGAHVALLTLLGVIVGPLYGYISDRIGRRLPIVIAIGAIGLGTLSMGVGGSGFPLVMALAVTGIFLWSVQDVINATAMDNAPPGQEGTVVGLMFASTFVAGVIAPIVAGIVVTATGDRSSVFFLASLVMLPSALALIFAPMGKNDLVEDRNTVS